MSMKYEWKKYIEEMRKDGYAVIFFEPEEFKDVATAREVEDWGIDCINECLEIRKQDRNEY